MEKIDTQSLVEILLDDADYFTDIDNHAQENGAYTPESLKELVESGKLAYIYTQDFSQVNWYLAAQAVNQELGFAPEGETTYVIVISSKQVSLFGREVEVGSQRSDEWTVAFENPEDRLLLERVITSVHEFANSEMEEYLSEKGWVRSA